MTGLNIIIPLAGVGSRFSREGFTRPKPFVRANGKEIIIWLLENLQFISTDKLVLVYNEFPASGPSLKNYFIIVHDFLAQLVPQARPEMQLVPLSAPTVGAAETVLLGIQALEPRRRKLPCVLLDGDTFYSYDVISTFRSVSFQQDDKSWLKGGMVFVFDDDLPDEAPYSYVKLKDLEHPGRTRSGSHAIDGIAEKNKTGMSPLACSGCYCFNSTEYLRATIKKTVDRFHSNISNSTEMYTSSIISLCLIEGGLFTAYRLEKNDFTVLGTPAQLRSFLTTSSCPPKRFCFDIDNTLVTAPLTKGDYSSCQPIPHMVQYVRKLHSGGHHIILHTARRMRTHGGNVGAVLSDIGALTLSQLRSFEIPFHEIYFGKPHADFYVDDKAVEALVGAVYKETGIL
jgi:capsule biosynthesis phosphatase